VSPRREPRLGAATALSLALIVYGNAKSAWLGDAPAGRPAGVGLGLGLSGLLALWAWRMGLQREELGLDPRRVSAGIRVGLATAGALMLLGLSSTRLLGARRLVDLAPPSLLELSAGQLWRRIVVFLPWDTALPEEVAFRGVLLAVLRRSLGTTPAVLLAAVPFGVWHLTLARLESPGLSAWLLLGKLGGAAAGGVLLSVLRLRSGSLLASVVAHETLDAALMLGPWLLARREGQSLPPATI